MVQEVKQSPSQSTPESGKMPNLVVTRRRVNPGFHAEVLIPLNYSEPTPELHSRLGEEVFYADEHAASQEGARNIYFSELTGGPQGGVAVAIRLDLLDYSDEEGGAYVRDFTRLLLLRLVRFDLASDLSVGTATIGNEVFEYELKYREAERITDARNKSRIIIHNLQEGPSNTLLEKIEAGLKEADSSVSGYSLAAPCHRIRLCQDDGELTIVLKFCFVPEREVNGSAFGMTDKERFDFLLNAADEVRLRLDPDREKRLSASILDGDHSHRCYPTY